MVQTSRETKKVNMKPPRGNSWVKLTSKNSPTVP